MKCRVETARERTKSENKPAYWTKAGPHIRDFCVTMNMKEIWDRMREHFCMKRY